MVSITDEEVLAAILADDGLNEVEREKFRDMSDKLARGGRALSKSQREWADRVYRERELDAAAPAENLVSAGLVPAGIPDPSARHFQKMQLPKKPPHLMTPEERRLAYGTKRSA